MPKKSFQAKKIKSPKTETEKISDQGRDKAVRDFCQNHQFERPVAAQSRTLVISLILAVLFGLISGLLSILLFFSGALSDSGFFSWIDIDSLLPKSQVIIEKNEQVTISEDERLEAVLNQVSASVVGIFNYKSPSSNVQLNLYTLDNYLGNALALTNDGWLVTTNDIVKGTGEYTIILQSGEIFAVKQVQIDASLGLTFLKIETQNLPVISFGRLENVKSGDKVLLISGLKHLNEKILNTRIATRDFQISQKLVRNSEDYYMFISLNDEMGRPFWGTPVFNFEKQVVGLATNYYTDYVIPINYIKKSFDRILDKNISRPYLGIEYINLANAISLDYGSNGALISGIRGDSPLKGLNVNVNDVILKVDNDNVNGNKNLTNLIQDYKSGDKINLTILDKDDKKEKVIEVVLK